MATLSTKKIRLAADAAKLNAPADETTGLTPAFYRGNDIAFEFAIFQNGTLMEVGNIASVTLEVKAASDELTPPEATESVLMTKTIGNSDLNGALTLTNWQNGSAAHGTIGFSAAESNIGSGLNWLSLWVTTNDSPGKTITLAAGPLLVLEDGASGSVQTPPAPTENFYTSTQSDARYAQRGANLGDLASAAAARLNLGLGSAATANIGSGNGEIPTLDAEGLLPEGIIPQKNNVAAGGVILEGGNVAIPNLTFGTGNFDLYFLLKRGELGSSQYLLGGNSGALGIYFASNNRLRASVIAVADILESSVSLADSEATWVRVTRQGGTLRMYFGQTLVGSLADSLNYSGAQTNLMASSSTGGSAFKGTVLRTLIFNRGLSDSEAGELKENGSAASIDRWGSQTNIYSAVSLTIGKRVYLKTSGSDSIVINGVTYGNGSGNTNATGGVEIVVGNSSISNSLSAASVLRYVGCVCDLDWANGCGYQLHDRSANKLHGLLSENGYEHCIAKRSWQLCATLSASGFIGGAARAVLPAGHVITRAVTNGGAGITLDLGEAASGETIINNHAAGSGIAAANLAGVASASQRLYATIVSGSGSLTLQLEGSVVG